ncbi:MAG: hypothetical protein IK012_10135 [Fibrobacter sp.]|uniref:hypothetical protein n=1 Tax=Fibrobacter sp. TaxID=35828 RepID=UPI0025BCAF64|nr:hypothetical protein [Fibrobacter sp.]MBR4785590.1 hypothetical protein [Fibrobacter sp.]
MKKNLYSLLIALGAILLWAACSDENSVRISGATEDPNMITADTSTYVLCHRSLAKSSGNDKSDECRWSAEMWSRESGYRVRTGFDNGTNTSGIWFWALNGANEREAHVDWPGKATADYDSMALADVIDKCGGSLCGTAYFDDMTLIYTRSEYWPRSSVSFEFSFAGKDSSGNFESVDASEMQGICIEYIGKGMKMELVLGEDSLKGWRESWTHAVNMPDYEVVDPDVNSKGYEICFPWSSFIRYAPMTRDVVPYLQGLRISIGTDRSAYFSSYFDIIGLGEYVHSGSNEGTIRPVKRECEVESVMDYFCDCSYSDERSAYEAKNQARAYFKGLLRRTIWDSSVVIPHAAEYCLNDVLMQVLNEEKIDTVFSWERPCDNQLPKTLTCVGGTVSESVEFSEVRAEYEQRLRYDFEREKIVVDSVVAQCLLRRDTLGSGDEIPDTCQVNENLWFEAVEDLDYAGDAIHEATEEFFDRMDSLNSFDSLDAAVRYCVNSCIEDRDTYGDKFLTSHFFAPVEEHQRLVKSYRCQSGKEYYTDEYKAFLQEMGIEDDTDSVLVYSVVKKLYQHKADSVLENCLRVYAECVENNCDE